jgi:hypothetical protein
MNSCGKNINWDQSPVFQCLLGKVCSVNFFCSSLRTGSKRALISSLYTQKQQNHLREKMFPRPKSRKDLTSDKIAKNVKLYNNPMGADNPVYKRMLIFG